MKELTKAEEQLMQSLFFLVFLSIIVKVTLVQPSLSHNRPKRPIADVFLVNWYNNIQCWISLLTIFRMRATL